MDARRTDIYLIILVSMIMCILIFGCTLLGSTSDIRSIQPGVVACPTFVETGLCGQ